MQSTTPVDVGPDFDFISHLSRGSYAIVVQARRKSDNQVFALKLLPRGAQITKHVEREIINHKRLGNHLYLIQLYDIFYTNTYLVLVLEYADKGSLRQLLKARKALPEAEARRLFQSLMLGVDYCHQMGIANRDIKPDNILLMSGTTPEEPEIVVKLADFGYSKDSSMDSAANTKLGTPTHTAPEILELTTNHTYDSKQADVWSCAVTLFEMVTGSVPWHRASDASLKHTLRINATIQRLIEAQYEFPSDILLSDDLKDLFSKMLVKDPSKRLDVKHVMRHPWFKKDLVPGAVMINKMLVNDNKANAPRPEEVERMKKIVTEAMNPPKAVGARQGFGAARGCDEGTSLE